MSAGDRQLRMKTAGSGLRFFLASRHSEKALEADGDLQAVCEMFFWIPDDQAKRVEEVDIAEREFHPLLFGELPPVSSL